MTSFLKLKKIQIFKIVKNRTINLKIKIETRISSTRESAVLDRGKIISYLFRELDFRLQITFWNNYTKTLKLHL
jgi:hypothetical protein